MPDAINHFKLKRASDLAITANVTTIDPVVKSGVANKDVRDYTDDTVDNSPANSPTKRWFYELKAITDNAVEIPYNIVQIAQAGVLNWLKSTNFQYACLANAVKTDSENNVIVVGTFNTSTGCDFGAGVVSGNGQQDGFIAKYNSTGTLLWTKVLGSVGPDFGYVVAIDGDDNIIVAGGFYSASINLGGADIANNSPTFQDIFVVKYTSAGDYVWSKGYGSLSTDTAVAVDVDSDGNVFVASQEDGTVNFGNGISATSHGSYDVTIAKFRAADGVTLWGKMYGGSGFDYVYGLTVDLAENVWVTGTGGFLDNVTNKSGLFLAKYSGADGSHLWSDTFDVSAGAKGTSVACDPATGNIVFTGRCLNANFGSVARNGIFIAAFSPAGIYLWDQAFSGSTESEPKVAVVNGYLGLTGSIQGAVSFGGPWLPGSGNPSYFAACFTLSGNSAPVYRWAKNTPSGNGSIGRGVAFDGLGNLITAGSAYGTVNFGTVDNPVNASGSNIGGCMFVAQYIR